MANISVAEQDEDDLFGGDSQKKTRSAEVVFDDDEIPHGEVDYLHDVPISMAAQIGSVYKSLKDILAMNSGTVVEFDKVVGEPMDVLVGGRLMCRGEIVVVNERYGIRISEVIRAEDSEHEFGGGD
ncbi:MAG: flagellar motor switch protein FliN [Proteobacteria bacterium]|nr:flagellar motor switch protein FliN [Pseudomonadota bacterium]